MIQKTQVIESIKPTTQAVASAKRVEYIDIAKGIGIVLVVMGHNDFALISPFLHKLIYSFHMPMFFFMSGMFFNPDIPFGTFIRQRYNKVLKPFFVTILLIYFATLSFSKISLLVASRRLLKAMYANGHYLDWVQLWFLPHLFAVSLLVYFFFRLTKRLQVFQFRWLMLAAFYIANILVMKLLWPFKLTLLGRDFTLYGLPFSVDLAPVTGLFLILGYELNKKVKVAVFENPFLLCISGILLIVLVWYWPDRIDLSKRQFDSLIINTMEALLGIFFVLGLSKQLERITWLSTLFKHLGEASLIILIFQVPIQEYWGQKILATTNNLAFSYWASFLAGVVGPILINTLLIRPNPIVRKWFSQPVLKRQETVPLARSVFE